MPVLGSKNVPVDKINLRLILVSGKTKEYLFSPSESRGTLHSLSLITGLKSGRMRRCPKQKYSDWYTRAGSCTGTWLCPRWGCPRARRPWCTSSRGSRYRNLPVKTIWTGRRPGGPAAVARCPAAFFRSAKSHVNSVNSPLFDLKFYDKDISSNSPNKSPRVS